MSDSITRADLDRLFQSIDSVGHKVDKLSDEISNMKGDAKLSEHRLTEVERKVDAVGSKTIWSEVISTALKTIVQTIIVGAIASLWLGIKQKISGG